MNCSYVFAFIVAGMLIINLGVWSGLIDKYLFTWSWASVMERFQYWRIFTGVFLCGDQPVLGFFNIVNMINTLKHIDERCYCSSRKMMMPIVASIATALVLVRYYPENIPFSYWQMFLIYLESREYPDVHVRVFFFVTKSVYIPLIYLTKYSGFSIQKDSIDVYLLTCLCSHVFYFLDDVLSVKFNISPILALEKAIVWLFKTLTLSNAKRRKQREGGEGDGLVPNEAHM